MSKELKCPYCHTELEQMHDKKMLGCPKCLHIADGAFWVKVIQSQKDLEIARKVLEEIKMCCADEWIYIAADKALEQIEHKDSK